ncbi:MAG TPA: RluA family pseudouridine synthase [Noviherbaspirillum sp.]|nr:RluA family pseudouridine synthase [Noviherbaspirillum sp.]
MELATMRAEKLNLNKTLPEADLDDGDEDAGLTDAGLPEQPAITLTLNPEFCGVRLDKVLSTLVPQYSRSRLQQWIEAGHVTVDGQPARAKTAMLGDETIVVTPQTVPEEQAFQPEPMTLPIVHEDATILVIDKPAGLVVHPAAGNWSGTMLNGLLHHFPALAGVPRAGIVHRLDKETSGLMVVAKTLEAQTDLVRQLQARTVKREYLALVWGMPQISGRIEAAISRHPRDRIKMAVSTHESAKPAVTHYQRLATGMLDGRQVSLLRCQLETGRTHQIRVHMASIGFALVGDPLYGKPHLASVFPRQALHAYRLGLAHPKSGKHCEWRTTLPADLTELFERAGIDGAAVD